MIATRFSLHLNLTVNRRHNMQDTKSSIGRKVLLLVLVAISTVHASPVVPLGTNRADPGSIELFEPEQAAAAALAPPPLPSSSPSAAVAVEPATAGQVVTPANNVAVEEGPVHVDLPLQPFGELQPPRRIVSYDQRQDGKYNIRADLENFMIVVIPSSPASGASLLDLLTRQHHQQKSSAANKASASSQAQRKKEHGPHKKYHAASAGAKPEAAADVTAKSAPTSGSIPLMNSKTNLVLLQEAVSAELARRQHSLASQQHADTFIEGRTPYRVDISSASAGAVQPLNAAVVSSRLPFYARAAKSLRPGSVAALQSPTAIDLGHNSVVLIGRMPASHGFAGASHKQRGFAWENTFVDKSDEDRFDAEVLLRGSDDDVDEDTNVTLIDAASASSSSGEVRVGDKNDSIDRLAAGELPKSGPSSDGAWDQLTLVGDGVEQCGPDRRRDSYGVCQFVPID